MQPTLACNKVLLRPLKESDYDELYLVASDPELWRQHPHPSRFKKEYFSQFFEDSVKSGGALVIIDQKRSDIIGSSRFLEFDAGASEIEIGWTFLARDYWGGYWNKLIKRLMISHALKYVDQIVFLVSPSNQRSISALEKIGAKRETDRYKNGGERFLCYSIADEICPSSN